MWIVDSSVQFFPLANKSPHAWEEERTQQLLFCVSNTLLNSTTVIIFFPLEYLLSEELYYQKTSRIGFQESEVLSRGSQSVTAKLNSLWNTQVTQAENETPLITLYTLTIIKQN